MISEFSPPLGDVTGIVLSETTILELPSCVSSEGRIDLRDVAFERRSDSGTAAYFTPELLYLLRNGIVPEREPVSTAVGPPVEDTCNSEEIGSFMSEDASGQLFPGNPETTRGSSTKLSSHDDKIVYTNGRLVIIRDLKDPAKTASYSGHVQPATVARISPSGYYCASGDASGLVKIWDTVGDEQILKNEVKSISGRINDLSWDGESKRIIAVGDGKGSVFMMDTGSSAGEVSGHSKAVNATSIRNQRPFRAVSGADDGSIVFYQGTPYKFAKAINTHTRFVHDVRYAPSGDVFGSVGADSKVFLYDGKTGDTVAELPDAHKGSVMALGWSPDSRSFITSSADCTVKLWDVETQKRVTVWTLGTGVDHQQVGNTWAGVENLVSLSMSGHLNVFDRRIGDKPSRVLYGHQKTITSGTLSRDHTLFAGAYDGRVLAYGGSAADGPQPVGGRSHEGQIVALASDGDRVFSVGFDDKLRELDPHKPGFADTAASLGSQPRSLSVSGSETVFIATLSGIDVFEGGRINPQKTDFDPTVVASTANGLVAVGSQDSKVRLLSWEGNRLVELAQLEGSKGQVTALAFSPDGSLLVGGDTTGKVTLFDVATRKLITGRWTFHSGRINSLAWTPDSKHIASGSLDTHIYIWSIDNPSKNIALKNVVPGGVSLVAWLDDTSLVAGGADACIRNFPSHSTNELRDCAIMLYVQIKRA
ncbi:WD40 repeat-like protein [Cantharellus anzutake]|uniref:WD40 repeat-like protein n=1 Tax=Cantharellus anzutake TaxID=1750568 RepID=UPI001904BFC2|nr:WD40 repeat-like protein [Cantharellus anzutake]KAF8342616.1 WD40 repeat-like protein [Cantharellus anzutake]